MTHRLISKNPIAALLVLGTAGAWAAACMSASPSNTTGSGTGKGGSSGGTTTVSGTGGTNATGAGGTFVTTGAGGTTVVTGAGGAGGTGGTTVVQKLCATKTTVMNPVLIDFETYNGTVTASMYGTAFGSTTANMGTAYDGPYSFGDGTATPTLSMVGGHPPSMWAVGETVMQTSAWGMGGGIWMSSCANASAYKGISFWVRGMGSSLGVFGFSVAMDSTVMPDATNPAGGGTCPGTADTCQPATKNNIPLTADWTQVTIMWADFTPGMSGTTMVVPNGDNITGLAWNVPLQFVLSPAAMGDAAGPYVPVASDLTINIDDIEFIP